MQMVLSYADDTNTIIEDTEESFNIVVECFEMLRPLTGLALNKDKSEIVPLTSTPTRVSQLINKIGSNGIKDMSRQLGSLATIETQTKKTRRMQ